MFMYLLRFDAFTAMIVWGCVLSCFCCIVVTAGMMNQKAEDWQLACDSDDEPCLYTSLEIQGAQAIAYILFALSAVYFVFMVCCRKQISLAIALTEETAKSINTMP